MTFIYNGRQASSNNLTGQVQVYKDGRLVLSTPFQKVKVDGQTDLDRIPFSADINIAGLTNGRYMVEVTVKDGASQKIAAQQTAFYIN